MEDLESFGDLRTGGQVWYCEQYAADLVLLGQEEAVIQGNGNECGKKLR
jgi:hypothetical protein